MKIVFLHTDFRLYWRNRLDYLGRQAAMRRHELVVLEIAGRGSNYAFDRQGRPRSDWKSLFPEREIEQLPAAEIAPAVRAALDEEKPDIVFAGALAYPSGIGAVRWCRENRRPVVIFDDARLADVKRSALVNFVKKQIYCNVDGVLIPAPSFIPDYEYWGIARERIFFGVDCVDNRWWNAASAENPMTVPGLSSPYLLGVGRQVPKKNWLNLLTAWRRSGVQLPLVLIGNGPERPELEKFIAANKLEKRVFLLDFQPPEALAPLYRNAAAVILPSIYGETWGLTVNEAMACGAPVLVSRQCGCCESLCVDGMTGLSFDPEISDMIRVLKAFDHLDHPSRERMRQDALTHIQHWGLEQFAENVLLATDKLTAVRGRGYRDIFSMAMIKLWKGRYRPT